EERWRGGIGGAAVFKKRFGFVG
ncbi:hypothetical protein RSK20926_01322, partial [Roseobacter sp. SK209-2-6]